MKASGYPIRHTFTAVNGQEVVYSIQVDGTQVYTGRVFPYSATDTDLTIDISEVCREYLDTFYGKFDFSGTIQAAVPEDGLFSTVKVFTVSSDFNPGDGADRTYTVGYNYNTDYISDLPDAGNLNFPVSTEIDPRQRIWICGYNMAGATAFQYRKNNAAFTTVNVTSGRYNAFSPDPDALDLREGDTVDVNQGGQSFRFDVVAGCRNRFALYYVNKAGGMDSLLCSGKAVESTSPSRTDVTLYDDRLDRRDWQQKRIYAEIDKQYQLNTGLLDDEGASRIDHLVNSPKVFIHDLEKDTVTSCLVTDTSYTVKTFRNDRRVQYTLNVKESQKQIRF